MRVHLFAESGGRVATADIPDFTSKPQVLFFGARVFVSTVGNFVDEPEPSYIETFAYALPHGQIE